LIECSHLYKLWGDDNAKDLKDLVAR